MAAQLGSDPATTDGAPLRTESITVWVPKPGLRQDLRAVAIVWRRELIRFRNDRLRRMASFVQPVLFLFVLGTGLSPLAQRIMPPGMNFKTFLFPGVVAMPVMITSIVSAGSLVWDREFGFLREMLVAPVSSAAIVVGKCLGGVTVATFQGIVILALAGLVHVPYTLPLLATLLGEMVLLAFTMTAFGMMMAARIKRIQAFVAFTQILIMPLFFLSGALYPLRALPLWLSVLTRANPLTYVVNPMRHAVFGNLNLGPLAARSLSPGVTWDGRTVPLGLSLAVVATLGLAMLAVATLSFHRTE